jgi:hypothetical protein
VRRERRYALLHPRWRAVPLRSRLEFPETR